ncbi:MAG TPA: alcohol dehydrogenase [Acholeplasmatales bacterium]|nr:MAG: alcohol dehydrogenase [Tenericutes bacterium GWF2_57_13]HAQ57253.1 alcohol dehydrogenase [Acholeplasmatales bacterium]
MNFLYRLWCRTYQTVFKIAWPFIALREPTLLSGPGSLQKLPEIVKTKGLDRILLVTDRGLVKAGLVAPLIERFTRMGVEVTVYDGTVPNPTIDNIEEAYALYLKVQAQGLVALGGGSAMDVAKAVGARVVNPKKSIRQMKGVLKVRHDLPPLFAVPTTAGTGSEATLAAVVTDSLTKEKYAINDPVLVPTLAVLDPRLTVSLPRAITATTGIDALTHAVEAYIGKSNTQKTRKSAKKAVHLIFNNLERVYQNGEDLGARSAMQQAAYEAGLAFTRAYVGNVHAIAHTLGGFYHVAHGLANAVILPYVLDFYGAKAAKPLAELSFEAGVGHEGDSQEKNAARFIAAIRALNTRLGIPSKIVGTIQDADLDQMIGRAMAEANPLYPVPVIMDKNDFRSIYITIKG